MKFGILCFDIGNSHDVTDVIQYAIKAEESLMSRFWLGEHYGQTIWNNPEPLLPIILGMTESINVGAAGILVNLHSSYRVACAFKLMNAVFPNRVDLGIAKGGTTPDYQALLFECDNFAPFPISTKIENLFNYFKDEDEYFAKGITFPPYKYPKPNMWLLGLSNRSLNEALNYNCNFSRSLFHASSFQLPDIEEIRTFKKQYFDSYGSYPLINIVFSGVVADNTEEAKRLYENSVWSKNTFIIANFIGSRIDFNAYINKLQNDFEIDELIFLDLSPSIQNKFETLQILQENR
jgi:alkanesulfonate monooxygenase SsuD/methylene tetrahydromethanopterin reductase-like flavin-dependent oxidoreductase (luciferase family)